MSLCGSHHARPSHGRQQSDVIAANKVEFLTWIGRLVPRRLQITHSATFHTHKAAMKVRNILGFIAMRVSARSLGAEYKSPPTPSKVSFSSPARNRPSFYNEAFPKLPVIPIQVLSRIPQQRCISSRPLSLPSSSALCSPSAPQLRNPCRYLVQLRLQTSTPMTLSKDAS